MLESKHIKLVEPPPKHDTSNLRDSNKVVIFTDGACPNNGKGAKARAGIGIHFLD